MVFSNQPSSMIILIFPRSLKNLVLEKFKFCKVEYLTFNGKVLKIINHFQQSLKTIPAVCNFRRRQRNWKTGGIFVKTQSEAKS